VFGLSVGQKGQWRQVVREYRIEFAGAKSCESKTIATRRNSQCRRAERLSWARWPEAAANATSPAIIFPWPKATIPRGTK
jgi:hypothetical protein